MGIAKKATLRHTSSYMIGYILVFYKRTIGVGAYLKVYIGYKRQPTLTMVFVPQGPYFHLLQVHISPNSSRFFLQEDLLSQIELDSQAFQFGKSNLTLKVR